MPVASKLSGIILFALLLAVVAPVSAQATRTWVSGVGDDANPCSRTAPCKTFAGAISKTASGGEINAIDPGGFGAVTITKSITIDGAGVHASILAAGTNGVVVNGSGIVVTLRNIAINGVGTGTNGISVSNVGRLQVENVSIDGFTTSGISFTPSSSANLVVRNTSIRRALGASGGGVVLRPGTGATATADLRQLRLDSNTFGLRVENRAIATLDDSAIAHNSGDGVLVLADPGETASALLSASQIVANGGGVTTAGVHADGTGAVARLSGSTVSGNSVGLLAEDGGSIVSFGDNVVAGNTSDGAATSTAGKL